MNEPEGVMAVLKVNNYSLFYIFNKSEGYMVYDFSFLNSLKKKDFLSFYLTSHSVSQILSYLRQPSLLQARGFVHLTFSRLSVRKRCAEESTSLYFTCLLPVIFRTPKQALTI